ncbi:hypothetical protein F4X88_11460 [Candidatus Poribacteria bacterium]|nr:hypothetical protein [Candidatus Poribacteria bacterium]
MTHLKLIVDIAVSVFVLVALIFLMGFMCKIYQLCSRILHLFNYTTLREMITQIERFCRRYANIVNSETSTGDIAEPDRT